MGTQINGSQFHPHFKWYIAGILMDRFENVFKISTIHIQSCEIYQMHIATNIYTYYYIVSSADVMIMMVINFLLDIIFNLQ